MFKVLIPAAAALALAVSAAGTVSSGSAMSESTAVPAMGWHLSHEGEMAKLAYGVANSDQLALMVTCSPGDSTAVVYGEVQPDTPRLISASLGPAPLDPLSGGDADEARISLHDPSLMRLASQGVLRVRGDAGAFTLTAGATDRRRIGEFLAYCGSSRI